MPPISSMPLITPSTFFPGLTAILVPDSNTMEDRTPLWHNVVTWPPGISVSCPPEPHMRRTRAVSLRPLGACCLLDKGLL